VDWARFPFEVDARLHLGAGAPTVRLRWVPTDQPFLPLDTQSVINNRSLNRDQASELPVGQLPLPVSNYAQDARWRLPAGMQPGHLCNAQWFATGEPWPTELPPTEYGPFWIPTCCGLFQDSPEGGLEVGGAAGDVLAYSDPTEGGLEVGGAAGDVLAYTDPTEGGLEVGGAAGDVLAYTDPTEGGLEVGGAAGDVFTPAGTPFYTNGIPDPTTNGYLVWGADEATSDFPATGETLVLFSLVVWVVTGDVPESVDWRIGSSAYGGDVATGTASADWSFLFTGGSGFDVWQLDAVVSVALGTGTYWLTLAGGVTEDADQMRWVYSFGGSSTAEATSFPPGPVVPSPWFRLDE